MSAMTPAAETPRLCLITGLEHGIPSMLRTTERIWPETNCYTDLWLGLLSALRLDPHACLPYTLAMNFLDDQWTFFKPSHDDLYTLYGIEVQEMTVWRPLIDHVHEHLREGRLVITEVDAWWLPDTAGTDYRRHHAETTIAINDLDRAQRRLGYFHNAGYHLLQDDDFDGLFAPAAEGAGLPLMAEVVNLRSMVRRPPDTLRHISRHLLEKYLERVPTRHPVRRWAQRIDQDLTDLRGQGLERYHAWAFAGTRQLGAAFELAAIYLRWIAGTGAGTAHLLQAADAFRQLSVLARTFILKGARAAAGGSSPPLDELLDRMGRHWSKGMHLLGTGEIVLDPPLVLRPAPAADGHDPATD
ncbi:MAG: hypothetical protein RL456_3472 [Pseudomonadota bacterium]|jgi:hypothetical protein